MQFQRWALKIFKNFGLGEAENQGMAHCAERTCLLVFGISIYQEIPTISL